MLPNERDYEYMRQERRQSIRQHQAEKETTFRSIAYLWTTGCKNQAKGLFKDKILFGEYSVIEFIKYVDNCRLMYETHIKGLLQSFKES